MYGKKRTAKSRKTTTHLISKNPDVGIYIFMSLALLKKGFTLLPGQKIKAVAPLVQFLG